MPAAPRGARLVPGHRERTIIRLLALVVVSLLALGTSAAADAKQVALVLANARYENVGDLANPANDAALIAQALGDAGFESVAVTSDAGRTEMMEALRAFRDAAQGADTALIYFAGHGVEIGGENWLIPTDAKLADDDDLPFDAIELELAMQALEGAKLRIAVLDACRNNPFIGQWASGTRAVSRGLAPVEVDDILVIYAAAPGQVAYDGADDNSPFASALARRIVQPGLPVQMLGGLVRDDVLAATEGEQRPFISASITGRPIYLVEGPKGRSLDLKEQDAADSASADADSDRLAWEAALKLDTIDGYRAYLSDRPGGAFASLAARNVEQLLDPAAKGGKLRQDPAKLTGFSALPGRYAVPPAAALPIDGIWTLSTNGRRVRIERGRMFAVDSWAHLVVARVYTDQVVVRDMARAGSGTYDGTDILVGGKGRFTLQPDGNLAVRIASFPLPVKFTLIREGVDDPEAFAAELSAIGGS